jgi:hypothetical protein
MRWIIYFYDSLSVKVFSILILFLSLLMLNYPASLHAQECVGDYYLTTQTEVDNFNCTRVTGSLTIIEAITGNITNIDGLYGLTSVGGTFRLQRNVSLNDVDGLSALNSVGALMIFENNTLINLDGLSALISIEGVLNIQGNSALTNIDGLSALNSVGYCYIGNNDMLSNVDGLAAISMAESIAIVNNDALTNINGFAALTSIQSHSTVLGNFIIHDNDALTNIDGLAALTSVGRYLEINGNSSLHDINGLVALTSVKEWFYINDNDALTRIDLAALTSVGSELVIDSNDALTIIDLAALKSVESLSIQGNDTLTSIDLTAVAFVGNLQLEGNNSLTNVDGLAALTSVEFDLQLEGNNSLTNLDGFRSLTSIGGILRIAENPILTDLDGLAALKKVAVDYPPGGKSFINLGLTITNNPSLTNVDGLSSLISVGASIYITGNDSLTNLDGLSALAKIGGRLKIAGNDTLSNIDGLSAVTYLGWTSDCTGEGCYADLELWYNPVLTHCCGLYPLLSTRPSDFYYIRDNGVGCNSLEEILIVGLGPCLDIRCSSHPSPFDGTDPLCDGDVFNPSLYPYVWPEIGIISECNFFTQCNGFYHEQRERYAPWEALGGEPITEVGNCMVDATVYESNGGTISLAADFDIDDDAPPDWYALYCSVDDFLDASDPLCDGGFFDPGVYVFVLPEEDINSVQITTQCNGFYHEQRERYAPWEALGGEPITDIGDCTVNATVYESDGGTVDITANFEINDGEPPPTYELRCSSDALLSSSDPLCDGGFFNPGMYVFVLPEEDINSVQFTTQCNGFYHEQRERYAPWEALGGEPIMEVGDCTVNATVFELDGGTVDLVADFNID